MDLARERNFKDNLKSSMTKQLRQLNAAEDVQLAAEDVQLAVNDVQLAAEGQLAAEDVQLAAKDVQLAAEDIQLVAEDVQLAAAEGASEGQLAAEEDTPVIHLMNSPFSNDDTIKQELLEYQKYPIAGEFR